MNLQLRIAILLIGFSFEWNISLSLSFSLNIPQFSIEWHWMARATKCTSFHLSKLKKIGDIEEEEEQDFVIVIMICPST